MSPHYAEAAFMKTILLLFSHMNFTHENISHAFNLQYNPAPSFSWGFLHRGIFSGGFL